MLFQSHLYGSVLRMDIIVYIILEEYLAYYEMRGKIGRIWRNSSRKVLRYLEAIMGNNMRSKLKSNDLITAQILKACANGASRTVIVPRPSSNSLKVISYLLLIDKGLIEVNSEGLRIVHKTTPIGRDMIERFERFHSEPDKLYA
jgi:predicted transcriptional regulator